MIAGFTRGPLLSMKGSMALLVVLIIDSLHACACVQVCVRVRVCACV